MQKGADEYEVPFKNYFHGKLKSHITIVKIKK